MHSAEMHDIGLVMCLTDIVNNKHIFLMPDGENVKVRRWDVPVVEIPAFGLVARIEDVRAHVS